MSDERIELLETKLAHLELALQELSDEMARQQKDIELLRERGRQLERQIESASQEAAAASATAVEIPPHY
ncbi:MAG: hypothetical protein AMXMBFR37_04760 [Steroidobacteraceae bacterium]